MTTDEPGEGKRRYPRFAKQAHAGGAPGAAQATTVACSWWGWQVSFNAFPSIINAFTRAVQDIANEAAGQLAAHLRAATPGSGLVGAATKAGWYVRTPTSSGYQRAVAAASAVIVDAVRGEGVADAVRGQGITDMVILAEVEAPPPGVATVANVVDGAALLAFGGAFAPSTGWFTEALDDFAPEIDLEGLIKGYM